MFVFVPASVREIEEKSKWFKKEIAQKISNKGIGFGFEIKGSVQGSNIKNISYPYGIHLLNNLATEWRNENKREWLLKEIEAASSGHALYNVLHGIRVSQNRPNYSGRPSADDLNFISDVGASDYLSAMEEMAEFIKYLQNAGLKIALETMPVGEYVMENGIWQPETYLDLKMGILNRDLKEMQNKTGCELLLDVEHLNFSMNFAKRLHNYSHIPVKIPENPSAEERKVQKDYEIFLRKGYVPVIEAEDFEKETEKIGAKIYHLCGTYNGREFRETFQGKIVSHSPISVYDGCFRKHLKFVLSKNPDILVLEVANPKHNPEYSDLPENSQETSFENFCKILDEELQ